MKYIKRGYNYIQYNKINTNLYILYCIFIYLYKRKYKKKYIYLFRI